MRSLIHIKRYFEYRDEENPHTFLVCSAESDFMVYTAESHFLVDNDESHSFLKPSSPTADE
jgi:hypothetical protein